jgi:hypothetical protein
MAKDRRGQHVSRNRWKKFNDEMKARVNYETFYENNGCQKCGMPSATGWQKCLSHEVFGGEDRNPSASYNIHTGYYHDFRAGVKLSFYDFLVAIGKAPDWREAQKWVADAVGVKYPNSKADKLKLFDLRPMDDAYYKEFCKDRPGITPEGLKLVGAVYGIYNGQRCLALPMYDETYTPNGYLFIPIATCGFKGGIKSQAHRLGGTDASSGFLGGPAVKALATQEQEENPGEMEIIWTEGPTDMLAGYSLYPDQLFVTNPYGCGEDLKDCRKVILEGKNIRVTRVADADEPGIAGGAKQVAQLMNAFPQRSNSFKLYYPPYPIEEKKGKDLRDFLVERSMPTWHVRLQAMHEEPVEIVDNEIAHETNISTGSKEFTTKAEHIMDELKIQFIGRDDGGGFVLQGMDQNSRVKVPSWGQFSYQTLLSVAGYRGYSLIDEGTKDDEMRPGTVMRFSDLKMLMAVHLASIPQFGVEIRGDGLWEIDDQLHFVKKGSFWKYDHGNVYQLSRPMIGENICSYRNSKDWFDVDRLNAAIEEMRDPGARADAYNELFSYVDSWAWENEHMSMMVCGLFYACWLQAALPWRPTITLIGETDSGKTWLLLMLSELYLDACQPYGKSTVAGVMQKIGFDSLPLELDEFDQSRNQRALFSEFRGSSRGQTSLKGTASQEGKEYKLRHMPWLCGIFTQTTSEADKNRLIELSLKKVDEMTINRPDKTRAHRLGYKLLASVIVCWKDIIANCEAILAAGNAHGKRTRYRESYAIPYGTLAAILGASVDDIVDDMEGYIGHIQGQNKVEDAYTDQEDVLDDIMGAVMVLGPHAPQYQATAAQILFEPQFKAWRRELETMGVVGKVVKNQDYICINDKMIVSKTGILRNSEGWVGNAGIKHLLKRLPKHIRHGSAPVHIGGKTRSCHMLSRRELKRWLAQEAKQHLFDKHAPAET